MCLSTESTFKPQISSANFTIADTFKLVGNEIFDFGSQRCKRSLMIFDATDAMPSIERNFSQNAESAPRKFFENSSKFLKTSGATFRNCPISLSFIPAAVRLNSNIGQ